MSYHRTGTESAEPREKIDDGAVYHLSVHKE